MSKKNLNDFTKEEFEGWRHNPITQAFAGKLSEKADRLTKALARDAFGADADAIRAQAGLIAGLGSVIRDLEVEQ